MLLSMVSGVKMKVGMMLMLLKVCVIKVLMKLLSEKVSVVSIVMVSVSRGCLRLRLVKKRLVKVMMILMIRLCSDLLMV